MSKPSAKKTSTLTFRIDDDLRRRVETAIDAMPYHPTMTAVVERGLELAIAEMHRISKGVDLGATGLANRNDMSALWAMNEHHLVGLAEPSKAKQIEAAE